MPTLCYDETTMENVSPLGIALIGCGGMAANYRASYVNIPGTVYRLVVDINEETARNVAREFGVERYSTDWREALADDIHIADISTPNHLHVEQAVALLNAGKHVIIQKPMAPTLAGCTEIVAAAAKANRQAGVYMSDLEDPLVWDIREVVQGGYLGTVTGVRARYAHRGGLSARATPENWRGSAEKTGGGSFMQLSIHHTNLLSWILDDTIESVMGYARNRMCPNIEGDDTCASVMEFTRTGVLATFDSAWNADGTIVEIYGSEGSIKMSGGRGSATQVQLNRPFEGRVIRVMDASPTQILSIGYSQEQYNQNNPFNQHVAFVEAVRDDKPFLVTAEIGLVDVAVVKAVYASSEWGRRVTIAEILKEVSG